MKKKKVLKKKPKSVGLTASLNALQTCIAKDKQQLDRLYKKAIAASTQGIKKIEKSIAKAQKQIAKNKAAKKPNAKAINAAIAEFDSLKNKLNTAASEKSSVEMGHKKLLAEEKVLAQFEKEWNKKPAAVKKTKKKSTRKTSKVKSITPSNPDFNSTINSDIEVSEEIM